MGPILFPGEITQKMMGFRYLPRNPVDIAFPTFDRAAHGRGDKRTAPSSISIDKYVSKARQKWSKVELFGLLWFGLLKVVFFLVGLLWFGLLKVVFFLLVCFGLVCWRLCFSCWFALVWFVEGCVFSCWFALVWFVEGCVFSCWLDWFSLVWFGLLAGVFGDERIGNEQPG